MAIAQDITECRCPQCSAQLPLSDETESECTACRWRGAVLRFRPIVAEIDHVVEALPEDAQCVHHEGNTATAICEGTGDYICALCSIDVGGRTYSAQFLENAGSDFAKQSFDRFLPRPDTTVLIFILLYFVPYVNSCWVFGTVVWLPLGYMKLVQANRLRYRNPIYHRVVGPTRIVLLAVFLTLIPGMILATWFVIAWLMLNTFNDF